jgi:hypothetical protein
MVDIDDSGIGTLSFRNVAERVQRVRRGLLGAIGGGLSGQSWEVVERLDRWRWREGRSVEL